MVLAVHTVIVVGVTIRRWDLPHSDGGVSTAAETYVTIDTHTHTQYPTSEWGEIGEGEKRGGDRERRERETGSGR